MPIRFTGYAPILLVGALVASAGAAIAAGRPAAPQDEVTAVSLVAKRFEFTPTRLEVHQGDRVRLLIASEDVTHGVGIKAFKIDKLIPRGGTPVVVEFVADKAGSFQINCSEYCGRRHDDMKGVLVVTPVSK